MALDSSCFSFRSIVYPLYGSAVIPRQLYTPIRFHRFCNPGRAIGLLRIVGCDPLVRAERTDGIRVCIPTGTAPSGKRPGPGVRNGAAPPTNPPPRAEADATHARTRRYCRRVLFANLALVSIVGAFLVAHVAVWPQTQTVLAFFLALLGGAALNETAPNVSGARPRRLHLASRGSSSRWPACAQLMRIGHLAGRTTHQNEPPVTASARRQAEAVSGFGATHLRDHESTLREADQDEAE